MVAYRGMGGSWTAFAGSRNGIPFRDGRTNPRWRLGKRRSPGVWAPTRVSPHDRPGTLDPQIRGAQKGRSVTDATTTPGRKGWTSR